MTKQTAHHNHTSDWLNRRSTHLRRSIAVVGLLLVATACGSEPTLIGDVAAPTAANETAATEPETAATQPQPTQLPAGVSQGPEPTALPAPDLDTSGEAADTTNTDTVDPEEPPATADADQTTIASGGAVATVTNVQFSVHDTVATTADPQSLLAGTPETTERARWITTIEVESLFSLNWSLEPSNFALELGDGDTLAPVEIFDNQADDLNRIPLSGRERHVVHLVFEPTDAAKSVEEADLLVTQSGAMDLRLPLTGSAYSQPYPLELASGASASMQIQGTVGCNAGTIFETQIEQASIDIEGTLDFGNYARLPEGERVLGVQLRITGTKPSTVHTKHCGSMVLWPDFTLMVDGRPTQAFSKGSWPDIEGFGSLVLDLGFQIPSSATSLELIGGTDRTSLANWTTELPLAVAEPGAERLHFSHRPQTRALTAPWGERPAGEAQNLVASGGAIDTMRFVEFSVGSSEAVSTAADTRTRLRTSIGIESTADIIWPLDNNNFVLIDPAGNPRAAEEIYDRTGSRFIPRIDGIEFFDVTVEFETDGLIVDPAGWTIQIENGFDRPLVLPLEGDAPGSGYPLGLRVGDNAQVPNEPLVGCADPLLDVTVDQITVDIEGSGHWGSYWVRPAPSHLIIPVDLLVTPLSEGLGCGALVIWPEFTMIVDGVTTNAYNHQGPSLDFEETGRHKLYFLIPVDTQTISLIGGSGRTLIGTWQLKDAGAVLENFGATQVDSGTLITLDETVLFAFGESTLQQTAYPPLSRVANVLDSDARGEVRVSGHTDSIGDDASNQALSEARAQAVISALIDAGVDAERLVMEGAGETQPVAPNTNEDGSDNPEGREMNRRVEILFSTE